MSISGEISARTALWNKLGQLVDVLIQLAELAIEELEEEK